DSMGLDLEQVHEVLGTGAAASFMFGDRGRRMVDGAFDDVRSALTIFVKDMGPVAGAAAEVGQQVPLAGAAQAGYGRGSEVGRDEGRAESPRREARWHAGAAAPSPTKIAPPTPLTLMAWGSQNGITTGLSERRSEERGMTTPCHSQDHGEGDAEHSTAETP